MDFSEQDTRQTINKILTYLKEQKRALTAQFLSTRFAVAPEKISELMGEMGEAGLVIEKSVLRNRVLTRRFVITRLGERYVDAGYKTPPEE